MHGGLCEKSARTTKPHIELENYHDAVIVYLEMSDLWKRLLNVLLESVRHDIKLQVWRISHHRK